jgi:hypothetical protein
LSKRLKAPRYIKLVKQFEEILNDPRYTVKMKVMAIMRLDDLYSRLDLEESRLASHKRRLELRALQVASPSIPLPALEPDVADIEKEAKADAAFAFLKNGGNDAAL